jgi:transcriptional regulator of NAD metabolism
MDKVKKVPFCRHNSIIYFENTVSTDCPECLDSIHASAVEHSIHASIRELIRIKGEEYVKEFVKEIPLPF